MRLEKSVERKLVLPRIDCLDAGKSVGELRDAGRRQELELLRLEKSAERKLVLLRIGGLDARKGAGA